MEILAGTTKLDWWAGKLGKKAAAKGYSVVTVPAERRMRLNGETAAQMDFYAEVKGRDGGKTDHSVDQLWQIDKSLAWIDTYLVCTGGAYAVLKFLVFFLPTYLAFLPVVLLAKAKGAAMPCPSEGVYPMGCAFSLLGSLLLLPPAALAVLGLLLDSAFFYVFSAVPFLLRGLPFGELAAGLAAIRPFRGGPSLWLRPTDVLACCVGQCLRLGACELTLSLANMVQLIPTLKYYLNANYVAYPAGVRFVQQISTSWADLGDYEACAEGARRVISRSKQSDELQEQQDLWTFVPHYPYPPAARRWAIGMQAASQFAMLLTHTTHAVSDAGGSREQQLLSNSAALPVYRVMLWYNNPYHFFTGWVEASISTGAPSQRDKDAGGEHPMWLVSAPSPFLTARDSYTGTGMIDAFFDVWLVEFTVAVRGLVRGRAVAEAMRQEVVSKDGLSRPKPISPGRGHGPAGGLRSMV